MGSNEDKLIPVVRSAEAAERRAGDELRKVMAVYEERSRTVDSLRARLAVLENRRGVLQREAFGAQCRGAWPQVLSHQTFSRRLGAESSGLRAELVAQEQDLEMARTRAGEAEQELLKSRMEKKKVETLLAHRAAEKRVRETAREEAFIDEVSHTHRRRGE